MTRKFLTWTLALLIISCLLIPGCSNSSDSYIIPAPPRGVTGDIETGKTVSAASQKVTAEGGTITVDKEDSPIYGLELTVPSASYEESRDFKISYSPIKEHTFGEAFNPVTPLISVENGGGYAEDFMEIKIPVEIPDDYFAMGFLYDDETQKLEGMPLIARDNNSITVATRHFTDMLISMIPYAELKKDIDTGFRPGIDDWQFVNKGSYIAKGGHCAGQSISALWYYCTQPDGQDLTLYGRYDRNGDEPATPDLQYDDTLGYRFASVIQKDIKWDSFANNLWEDLAGVDDQMTWYLFAYAMQLTGEPQEAGIFSSHGGGHDMICYRIYQGNLYIADPNYPGDINRRIEFIDGKFKPYNSGENAEEIAAGNGKEYETIEYCAKTTTIDWSTIEKHWKEFKEGTIGDDYFPAYQIVYQNAEGEWQEIKDGINISENSIAIKVTSTTIETGWIVYKDGKVVQPDREYKYILQNGENQLGIYALGKINDKWRYIDFKYITVNCNGLTIEASTQTGKTGEPITFTAVYEDSSDKINYGWYINGYAKGSGYGNTYTITPDYPGEITAKVELFDDDFNIFGEAEITVTVVESIEETATEAKDNLSNLKRLKYLQVGFSGMFERKNKTRSSEETSIKSFSCTSPLYERYYDDYGYMELTWSGNQFSSSYSGNTLNYTLSGTVSEDGMTIESMVFSEHWERTEDNRFTERDWSFSLKDLPVEALSSNSEKTEILRVGDNLKISLSDLTWNETMTSSGEFSSSLTVISPDWTESQQMLKPRVTIRFYLEEPD